MTSEIFEDKVVKALDNICSGTFGSDDIDIIEKGKEYVLSLNTGYVPRGDMNADRHARFAVYALSEGKGSVDLKNGLIEGIDSLTSGNTAGAQLVRRYFIHEANQRVSLKLNPAMSF